MGFDAQLLIRLQCIGISGNRPLNFKMLMWPGWPGASPGGAPGATGSFHLGDQKRLGKKYSFDVRDAHGLPQHFG